MNNQWELSAKFATLVKFTLDNLSSVLIVTSGIMAVLAVTYLPALITALKAFGGAAITLATTNPVFFALTAIIVVIGLVVVNFDKLTNVFKKFQAATYETAATIYEYLIPALSVLDKLHGGALGSTAEDIARIASMRKAAADIRASIKPEKEEGKKRNPAQDILDLADALKKVQPDDALKLKQLLAEINKEFLKTHDVEAYNKKLVSFDLFKLKKEFADGKTNIFQFNEGLKKIDIQALNRELRNGGVAFSRYQEIVRRSDVAELNAKFRAGIVTLVEYHSQIIKISEEFLPGSALVAGTSAYIQSIGTLSENIAKGITATFTHLEDTLVEFIKTGEFNFAKFTESILDDLTRIIIRAAILQPLATGILNLGVGSGSGAVGEGVGSSAGASAGASIHATGDAFYNGQLQKYARGGIVSSPTAFSYGGGKRGLMGEAGTEAILPLKRGSGGNLGVSASLSPVTVNIINQSGGNVEKRESTGANGEKTLDIIITQKVREGMATGRYDAAMKQSYGLNRKGA